MRRGEFFGIVGRNGSGKSTLLKCMAGIYGTDHGRIFVDGRVSTFIELGVGFNMDLPARDNILINATMLGLAQREARRRTEAVLEFAELEEFVDLKLKNYSSGMLVRLAFSVMIQVDADVLLIDEVLAVGDAAFQQKCFDEFARLRRENRTVVLVTHEMGSVERFCDRAMLLERGHVADIGEPRPVAMHYLQMNFSRDARAAEAAAGGEAEPPPDRRAVNTGELRAGDGGAEIVNGWFMDAEGHQVEALEAGQRCAFCMHVRFHEDAQDPVFAFALRNADDERVIVANSEQQVVGVVHRGRGGHRLLRLRERRGPRPLRRQRARRASRLRRGVDGQPRALPLGPHLGDASDGRSRRPALPHLRAARARRRRRTPRRRSPPT